MLGDRVRLPLEMATRSISIWMQDLHSAIRGPSPVSDSGVRYTSKVMVQKPMPRNLVLTIPKAELAASFPDDFGCGHNC